MLTTRDRHPLCLRVAVGVWRPSRIGCLSIPCDIVFARSAWILRSSRDTASSVVGLPSPTAWALKSVCLHDIQSHTGRPGPPASGPRHGQRGHGVSPHPMERGQPRWGRLPDLSVAPDVVTVHLNRLTHAFQHVSASLSHASHDSAASASGLPSSGGGGERAHPLL